MRIIMILPYSSLVVGDNYKPDIFGDGYHIRLAKQIWKESHKYQIECWRVERKLKQELIGEKDSILYRAFPSWRPSLGKLTNFVYKKVVNTYAPLRWGLWREYSLPLLKALKKEIAKGDVLILLYHVHFDLSYLVSLMCKNVPLIGQHIGGHPFAYNKISWFSHLPFSLIEKRALSNLDVMLMGTEWHYNAFKKFYGKSQVFYPFPECIDFDLFKPMDKFKVREELNIAQNKKVIIHIGRFDKAKGFDTVLDILPDLKKNYDIEFIAIGGTKGDMFYERAINEGVRVLEWQSQNELVKYFSASDVYLFPKFYDKTTEEDTEKFMGAGLAPIEAMACNLPVIGTNLKGFYASKEELKGVGIIPKDKNDLVLCVENVFDNPESYDKCREVAMKYYSWQPKVERLLKIIEGVSEKYYG